MTCERMQEILDAYMDGETPAPDAREIEEHLHECAACAGQLATRRALQQALRTKLAYHRAPAAVLAGTRAVRSDPDVSGVALPKRAEGASRAPDSGYGTRNVAWWRRVAFSMAACFALVSFALIGLLTATPKSSSPPIAQVILSNHLRSLEGVSLATAEPYVEPSPHLIDVLSSDKHTVKPWFAGKLPFAPPVPELEGFTLVGGRLDRVLNEPAAAIVYRRDKHLINLFIWPRTKFDSSVRAMSPMPHEVAGYHEVEFMVQGFSCWAVSDVEAEQLMNFARAYQKAASEGTQTNH